MPTLPEIPILHRGRGFAAIDKPAGLAVGAERNKPAGAGTPLLDGAAAALGVECVLVVHRLDRDTSGVMLVATEAAAHRSLSMAFQNRQVDKRYWVLIRGEPPVDSGSVDAMLEPDPGKAGAMRIARHGREGAKKALTHWTVLRRFRGFTLVEARPETGRMHQIRVHLRHAGLPLAVDPAYGAPSGIFLSELKRGYKPPRDREEPPVIGRVTLHARSLAFADPSSGEPLTVTAEPPKDLARALDLLEKHSARRGG